MKGNKKMKRKGFTLIELLVVIAIIGLLSTMAVVALNGARSKARDARRTSDLKTIQTAIELYKTENSNDAAPVLPATWAAFSTDLEDELPGGVPSDPGSNVYVYCVDSANTDQYLLSATLENDAQGGGGIVGTVSTFATTECRNEDGANPTAVPTCNATTGFCLGQL